MKVAVIKYNAGNIQSVLFALERLGIDAVVSENPEEIKSADKVIFPGVGEAGSAMQHLKEHKLDILIKELKQPVLGICLGMQLLCAHSEEGNTPCLNIFPIQIKKFKTENALLKIPQIGWNTVYDLKGKLFNKIDSESYMYFVHSYYAEISEYGIASTEYILQYSSALNKNNFYAAQFHPEKSANAGEQLLRNFLEL